MEYCTNKYNINYGTALERRSEKLKNRKDCSKPILQFDLEGKAVAEYHSIKEAERQTGFKVTNICQCLKGKIKTAYGFIWKYKD